MINTVTFRIGISSTLVSLGVILISASLLDAKPKGITPKEKACDDKLFVCWHKCAKSKNPGLQGRCDNHCVETWSRCNGYAARTQPPRPLPKKPTSIITSPGKVE